MANADIADHLPRSSPVAGQKPNPLFNILAGVVIAAGIIYAGYHLADDLSVVRYAHVYPYVLLGIALLIALGFEFVNGFHDTVSSGAVAFGIVSLLPLELILQVGSGAGFAMVLDREAWDSSC